MRVGAKMLVGALWCLAPSSAEAQQRDSAVLVLLGTGMPRPNLDAASPASAIVVGTRVFLVDAGSGVQRQLVAAGLPNNGVTALFVTHLHSDHTLGLPDLMLTTWVMGRKTALPTYGPRGIRAMTDHLVAAWSEDIKVRTEGLEHEPRGGYKLAVHEINAGVVYDSGGVKVTAIKVDHGDWQEAYGYKFEVAGRSIVISGDTRSSSALMKAATGADILVHEAYPEKRLAPEPRAGGEDWPRYMKAFHTSDVEVGRLASQAKPKLLILHHLVRMGGSDEELLAGVRAGGFTGRTVIGKDLQRY